MTVAEQTVAILKPDAFEKRVVGAIVTRIETEMFTIVNAGLFQPGPSWWRRFYAEHEGKPFLDAMCAFMSSGPVLAMVLSRENAIAHWRRVIGPTDPRVAYERNMLISDDTLRGFYGDMDGVVYRNSVHGSSDAAAVQREKDMLEFA